MDLGLEVALEGDSLSVSWNKDSTSVANAERGILFIWDGESEPREVDLGVNQLRTGIVLLSHVTNRVSVRLQLVGTNGEIGESARVTLVDKSPVVPPSGSTAEARDRIPTIEIDPPTPRDGPGEPAAGPRVPAETGDLNLPDRPGSH